MSAYVHVYYRLRGSQHWWCRCFQQGAWHGCLSKQEEDVVRPYSYAAGRQVTHADAQCQMSRYVHTICYSPLVEEIRTLQSEGCCPYFEQWTEPPAEAVLHWKAASAELTPADPVRRYCACGRVLGLQDPETTCSTCRLGAASER